MLSKLSLVKKYNETHNIINLFGIKLKFPKPEIIRARRQLPYENYKKNNIDITIIPPAKGTLRKVQKANLALLKELDFVCKQNNLTYWLDFGTLLGAYRHSGFIHWDDDIDVGMLREDYNKIIEAFKETSRNPDIYADYVRCPNNTCQIIIKVQHKKCPHLFVDIFPYDYYNKHLTKIQQENKTIKIKTLRESMQQSCSLEDSDIQILKLIEKNLIKNESDQISDLVWGIDFNHHWKNWFFGYKQIFPLKEIKFEQFQFPCFNKHKKYLEKVYGNYMEYPKKFGYGHSMFTKFTTEEENIIKELAKSVEAL